MDDLISRKALLEEFRKRSDEPFELWDSYDIFKIIHNAPTVDAVEAAQTQERRGTWAYYGRDEHGRSLYRCNGCGNVQVNGGKFCSNCGRRNEGKVGR